MRFKKSLRKKVKKTLDKLKKIITLCLRKENNNNKTKMKQEVLEILEAELSNKNYKNLDLLKKVLMSLKGRYKKYGDAIHLSRYEYKKFNTTEDKLRGTIKWLKDQGLLIDEGLVPTGKFKINKHGKKTGFQLRSRLFKLSNKVLEIFEHLVGGIENLFPKVENFCNKTQGDIINTLRSLGINIYRERGYLIERKVSVGKRGQIKNWKTGKGYNIFTYLMEVLGLNFFNLSKLLIKRGYIV